MTIIVSDLEGTLTTGSSWKGIASYYKKHISFWRYTRFLLPWVWRYFLVRAGLMDRRTAMFAWMQDEVRLFVDMPIAEFEQMVAWVVEQVMWPGRRMDVLAELEKKRQNGATIAVVSSAYQPVVDAFASRIGAVPIGTQLILRDDKLWGIEDPLNAYEYKKAYIRQVLGAGPITAAYGDTLSDLPMLEMSHEPVAVYPDSDLIQEAEHRGWRIIQNGE